MLVCFISLFQNYFFTYWLETNEMYFFDSLDPNNRRALEGMHRIDNSSSKLDTSYYMTVGEEEGGDTTYERIADSENEVLC